MTTIRGRIYHQTADVRSVTDRHPVLIPAGWTIQIRINGISTTYRHGIPTWHEALTRCDDILKGIKYGIIHEQTRISAAKTYSEPTNLADNHSG